MRRDVLVTISIVVSSCQHRTLPTERDTARPDPPAASTFPIDYSRWTALTHEPVRGRPATNAACAISAGPDTVDSHLGEVLFRFYTAPESVAAVKGRNAPYAVGTTVVKEKLDVLDEKGKPPFAVAAMVKREPGYDPENGDWEYIYAKYGDKSETQRGKLASCISCHRIKQGQDYLYLNYLKEKPR